MSFYQIKNALIQDLIPLKFNFSEKNLHRINVIFIIFVYDVIIEYLRCDRVLIKNIFIYSKTYLSVFK